MKHLFSNIQDLNCSWKQLVPTKAPPVSFEHNNSLSASHVKLLRKQNFDSVQLAQKVHLVV